MLSDLGIGLNVYGIDSSQVSNLLVWSIILAAIMGFAAGPIIQKIGRMQSVFVGLFSNKWLWGAIGLSVALQLVVVYVPFLNFSRPAGLQPSLTARMMPVNTAAARMTSSGMRR